MLVIRLQRTGRKGHSQYRLVVQDSRQTPTSGKVVALLGSYNPHTKAIAFDKEKAQTFLNNGAQPSNRVAQLLQANEVKLPYWVVISNSAQRGVKNPEKLRKNRPAVAEEPVEEVAPAEAEVAEPAETTEEVAVEAPVAEVVESEEVAETPVEVVAEAEPEVSTEPVEEAQA